MAYENDLWTLSSQIFVDHTFLASETYVCRSWIASDTWIFWWKSKWHRVSSSLTNTSMLTPCCCFSFVHSSPRRSILWVMRGLIWKNNPECFAFLGRCRWHLDKETNRLIPKFQSGLRISQFPSRRPCVWGKKQLQWKIGAHFESCASAPAFFDLSPIQMSHQNAIIRRAQVSGCVCQFLHPR